MKLWGIMPVFNEARTIEKSSQRFVMTPMVAARGKHQTIVYYMLVIGMLALVTRTSVALLTTSWVFTENWSFGYEMGEIAASLASGDGFSWPEWSSHPQGPTAWMPPVYPMVMALAFKTFGIYSEKAAISLFIFQTLISLLTCFLLYHIGKRVFNSQVGLLTAFLFAVYPPAIHFSVQQIWSTLLFACCLSLLILSLLEVRARPNVSKSFGTGLLAGFTALVDPIVVVSYPLIAIWLYVTLARNRIAMGKLVAAACVAFTIMLGPWLLRNYFVFGRYVFIKSNLGHELFLGNNPYASGSFAAPQSKESLTVAEKEFLSGAEEPSRNGFLLLKAITFISAHPDQFWRLTLNRVGQYWTFMMRPVKGFTERISLWIYFGVLALALIGVLMSRRSGNVQLLWLLLLALPLPYYIAVVGLFRYRFMVEMLLLLFCSYAIHRFAQRFMDFYRQLIGSYPESKPNLTPV